MADNQSRWDKIKRQVAGDVKGGRAYDAQRTDLDSFIGAGDVARGVGTLTRKAGKVTKSGLQDWHALNRAGTQAMANVTHSTFGGFTEGVTGQQQTGQQQTGRSTMPRDIAVPMDRDRGTAGGQQVTRQHPYGRRLGTFQGPGMDSPRDVFEHESLARRGRYDLDVQGEWIKGMNRSQMAELFGRPDMDPRRTELTRDQMRQRMQYDREVEQAQRSREKSPFDRLPTLSPDATTAERARFGQQLQAATAESGHQRGMRGQDIQQRDAATGHALTGQKLEEQMRQFGLQHGLDQRKLDKNLKMFRETMEKDDWWKGADFLTQMTQGGFGMEQAADIAAEAFTDAFQSAAMSDDPGAMQKVTEDFLDVTKDLSQKISPEGHASAWETILRDVMGEHYGIDLAQTERTREEAEVDPDRYMR